MALTKIQSLGITDGTIVNADINASAAIVGTKLTGVGKVLQVVNATDNVQRNTTSTSFVTGSNTLSVSITPSSASNKVFIVTSGTLYQNIAGVFAYATIFRGATDLGATGNRGLMSMYIGSSNDYGTGLNMSCLDSPNTTSATTYQVYFRTANSSGTTSLALSETECSITAFEIAG